MPIAIINLRLFAENSSRIELCLAGNFVIFVAIALLLLLLSLLLLSNLANCETHRRQLTLMPFFFSRNSIATGALGFVTQHRCARSGLIECDEQASRAGRREIGRRSASELNGIGRNATGPKETKRNGKNGKCKKETELNRLDDDVPLSAGLDASGQPNGRPYSALPVVSVRREQADGSTLALVTAKRRQSKPAKLKMIIIVIVITPT